eukprot:gnl/MRDRNA2_/MRDRNA2_165513_c0_seq1.p1 gnl/MRDRNA2_/MRDRNA2_165513_c0~~gnl/MRDRNA2_/MRDRNA2_165513_c0_seq1.p1  ORF type:complete len:379 (-),score=45.78 gnl/MRDRNA2_/MRDRNA2_165513_c0_seq1:162-1298(-)
MRFSDPWFQCCARRSKTLFVQCRSDSALPLDCTGAEGSGKCLPCNAFTHAEVPSIGIGVFANQAIGVGTLIATEKPVMKAQDEAKLESLFRNLSNAMQEVVMSLYDNYNLGGKKSLAGIFRTNSYPCGTQPSAAKGLFLQMSRFNHSCSPNAFLSWDETTGSLQLRAIKDISPKDEICVCYVDPSFPCSVRQKDFQRELGFTCRCMFCQTSDASAKRLSDKNRSRIQKLREKKACISDPAQYLACCIETIDLYAQEGLVMPSVMAGMARDAFLIIHQTSGSASTRSTSFESRLVEAKKYAQLASEQYSYIWGNDHETVKLMRSFVDKPSQQNMEKVARKILTLTADETSTCTHRSAWEKLQNILNKKVFTSFLLQLVQ